jgi:outer membrane protein TolC
MNLHTLLKTGFAVVIVSVNTYSQDRLEINLEQAKIHAAESNHRMRIAELDGEAARFRIKEITAAGLPQISGDVSYMDNIAIPVQLIPGDFFGFPGQDLEVQFGTKYSMNAGLTVNQLLFSGSYLVALQAAREYMETTRREKVKTRIEVERSVSEAYFLVAATKESIAVIDSLLSVTNRLEKETREIFEAGLLEETDLDQLVLMASELEMSRDNASLNLKVARSLLLFHMGMETSTEVVLQEDLSDLIEAFDPAGLFAKQFDPSSNIDMLLLKQQQKLAELQIKLDKSAFLPSLSAFFNYQNYAQRPEWNFFDTSGKWYQNAMFGVSLSIPILSSGERMAKLRQSQISFRQTKVAEDQLSESLKLKHQRALNELINSWKNLENTDLNKTMAKRIFERTGVKFREGMAGSLELLNAHNQYLNSHSRYINSALTLLNKKLEVDEILLQN